MEVDIQCDRSRPGEIPLRRGSDWLEILAAAWCTRTCGATAASTRTVSGFAWGMGIDRIAMLKYA